MSVNDWMARSAARAREELQSVLGKGFSLPTLKRFPKKTTQGVPGATRG
jgi:hypothetical protein